MEVSFSWVSPKSPGFLRFVSAMQRIAAISISSDNGLFLFGSSVE